MKLRKGYLFFGIFIIVVAALAAYFLFYGRQGRAEKKGESFVVKRGSITHFTEQTGIIKAQVGAIVKVGTRATGTLTSLRYQVGDYVKKGELIAEIDDREKVANKKSIEAQLEEQKKDLEAKRAQYEYARINYEREKSLLEREFTTKDNVDKAKRELDVALAQLELSKAKIKEAEESLNALNVSLSYHKIYAPISGYVSQVTTQEGETIVAGLSAVNLITIIDTTKLEMWIYVDETDIGRTKPGMKVEYWVDAYRDKKFYGKIDMIYPQPEIKDNIVYYLAIVKIDRKDAEFLKPEMTSHARIIVQDKKDVIVVPNNAVRFEEGKTVVYVKGREGVEKRPVTTGIRDDRFTEVISGVTEGETIMIPAAPSKKAQTGTTPPPGIRK
ncbi:MAG: efflux RND transporter periplasmic adaptor subunit [Syntrophorhabdaceae bacterium]|nr:efflux RND transporter periplasmic adaptor subunit [Syntrophorhabdaceae bacterium]